MPDFLNNTDTLRGIVYTLCFVVFLLFVLFVVAKARQTDYQLDSSTAGTKQVRKVLRRWLPALLAAGLSFGYYCYTAQQHLHQSALRTAVRAGQLNADDPLVAEAANSAVPPFGDVTGKLVYALGLFLTGIAATWFVLRFVVPVVPRWATGHGTKSGGLPGQPGFAEGFAEKLESEKVDTTLRILVALWALWGICALSACLVK